VIDSHTYYPQKEDEFAFVDSHSLILLKLNEQKKKEGNVMIKKVDLLLVAVGLVLFFGMHEAHAAKKIDLLANGMQLSDQWVITDGVLSPSEDPGGIIWSKDIFDDFEISIEYKTAAKCNSGLFFRADPKNPVQGGFEVQIASPGLYSGKHVAGSLYDAKEPTVHAGKPDGKWNKLTVRCNGPHIQAVLNGEEVLDLLIDDWTTPEQNPDGTKNKFKTALKDLPRKGHIGFQYHGHPVWIRNVQVNPLNATASRSKSEKNAL